MNTRERFEAKYMPITESGCWVWIGWRFETGYGQFQENGKRISAHRYSYKIYKGEIPEGMYICHKCDEPSCVNPEHLFLGSPFDNMMDMHIKKRGRCASGENHYKRKHA